MDSVRDEQRQVLKFLCLSGRSPSECNIELSRVYGEKTMKLATLYKWYSRFSQGRASARDDPRPGRSRVITEKSISAVKDLVDQDRRVSQQFIRQVTGLSYGSIAKILHHHLHLRKIVARWVPHCLNDEQLKTRVDICTQLFAQYRRQGRRFLGKIVTGDETWVHYHEPESKRESMCWTYEGEPSPTKFKAEKSLGKVLYSVFWDQDGIILLHQVPDGQRINAQYYSKILKEHLSKALREKRPNLKTITMLLQHDNAPAHTAKKTLTVIKDLGWTTLPHPPYSPDLAPSDYHLFSDLKKYVRGRHFRSRSSLGSAVYQWSQKLDRQWLLEGILQLPKLWQKCIAANGSYFEK